LVSTRRVWTATFAFSSIASALVGLLIGGFAGTSSDGLRDPYLFQSVVAVIVGGTVFGGPGDYTRTCVVALFLTVLTSVPVGHGRRRCRRRRRRRDQFVRDRRRGRPEEPQRRLQFSLARAEEDLHELSGQPDREPVGDDQDHGQAAVEDRLRRLRHHEPVQPA